MKIYRLVSAVVKAFISSIESFKVRDIIGLGSGIEALESRREIPKIYQ